MKITLKKKDLKRIKAARKVIKDANLKHDEMVTEIAKDYGWEYDSENWLTLWDHIVNESDWTVEYK